MFRNRRERKRVDAEFAQLTEQLADVESDIPDFSDHPNSAPLRLHQASGPRDYSLSSDDGAFIAPRPGRQRLAWHVWMTLIAAAVMVFLPIIVALWARLDNLAFILSEAAASLVFVAGLFFSLRR